MYKILNKEIILASQLLHFIAEISSTMIKKKFLQQIGAPLRGVSCQLNSQWEHKRAYVEWLFRRKGY